MITLSPSREYVSEFFAWRPLQSVIVWSASSNSARRRSHLPLDEPIAALRPSIAFQFQLRESSDAT